MSSMTVFRSWRQSYAFIVLGTLAVVAAADFFLYGHRIGWTTAAVAAAMLAVLAIRDTTFLKISGGRVAWLAAIGLLAALVEQPTWLNILYILVCLSVLTLINSQGWDNSFSRWVGRLARWLATGWTRLFLDNGIAMRWLIRRGFSPTLARGIAAWVIPLLFTSVFVAIFAWANPIISGWFSQLGTWLGKVFEDLPKLLNGARILFWLMFAMLAWSLLRSRTHRGRHRAVAPHLAPRHDGGLSVELPAQVTSVSVREHNALGIPASMVIRCLILFNLVFFVENVLDTRYLFWAQLPAGVTYTEYVHRGAYPLIAAALLAAVFVLVTFNPRSETERSPWARRLVYLWVAQTIFLTLTAAFRLVRYVEMSALTRLRVASTIWFMLVALGLFYIIWRIVRRRSNGWLVNANAITALLVLYPCCFFNFDGMIASFNARHCAEAGGGGTPLDIDYMQTLGTPSLPALDSVKHRLHDRAQRDQAESVSRQLRARLAADVNDWRSWTWRRHRTAQTVNGMLGPQFSSQDRDPRRYAHNPWTPPAPAAKVRHARTFP